MVTEDCDGTIAVINEIRSVADFAEFCMLYKRAKKEGLNIFIFKGQEVLTEYAKYLIEFVKDKTKNKT